jgi:hypothetical protein
MIQITPQMRIVAAVEPADFRRGIDGLARLCKDVLKHDPFRGWVFVFRNRSATALPVGETCRPRRVGTFTSRRAVRRWRNFTSGLVVELPTDVEEQRNVTYVQTPFEETRQVAGLW